MLVERPDDDGGQVSRIDVFESDPHYVFDRKRADQLGIMLGEIEAKVIDLAFNQELGNLCVLLKSKHKAAREIRLRNIELLGGDPLLDYPRDLGLEPPNCAIDVLRRGSDVSNEPARIKTRARGDVPERCFEFVLYDIFVDIANQGQNRVIGRKGSAIKVINI